jgi:hypothetical protein
MQDTTHQLNNAINELMQAEQLSLDWDYKISPDKWSKKEVVGHLIDSALNNLQRFVRCTYEENFKLIYQQNEWVQAQHYQDAPISELLALWRLLNLQIINILRNYPPQRLQIQCDTGKDTVQLHTVEYLAHDYVLHLKHHLKQIY